MIYYDDGRRQSDSSVFRAPSRAAAAFCRRVRTFGINRDKDPKPTFHHRQHVATRAHRVNRLCRREKCVITSMLHSFKTYWLLALIKTFLSTFKCQDKDITSGFADIDIEDEQKCIDVRDERPQISQPTGALKTTCLTRFANRVASNGSRTATNKC